MEFTGTGMERRLVIGRDNQSLSTVSGVNWWPTT